MMKKPSKPITLSKDLYWQIRAQLLECQTLRAEAERAWNHAQARVQETMKAAGLDPSVVYQLNDADLTATAQQAPS